MTSNYTARNTQVATIEALLRRINPTAEVVRTRHSKLDPASLLGKARFIFHE